MVLLTFERGGLHGVSPHVVPLEHAAIGVPGHGHGKNFKPAIFQVTKAGELTPPSPGVETF